MYIRTTGTQRKIAARAAIRYAHVSVEVGRAIDKATGYVVPTRTPRGTGSSAHRANPKPTRVGRARRTRLAQERAACDG